MTGLVQRLTTLEMGRKNKGHKGLERTEGESEGEKTEEKSGATKTGDHENVWDDEDYADYVARKNIKDKGKGKDPRVDKLETENQEMKDQINQMKTAWRKSQGMDDYMFSMTGITSEAKIQLPPKFKIADYKKFDGTGDPKQHLH